MTLGIAAVTLAAPLPSLALSPLPRGPRARPCLCGSTLVVGELTWPAIEATVIDHVRGDRHRRWALERGFVP